MLKSLHESFAILRSPRSRVSSAVQAKAVPWAMQLVATIGSYRAKRGIWESPGDPSTVKTDNPSATRYRVPEAVGVLGIRTFALGGSVRPRDEVLEATASEGVSLCCTVG